MRERYRVQLNKEHHVFSAAHFITYDGDICERLHGHNYRVAVEIDGPLDENAYVIDFIALRDALRRITDRLDHRVMLPTEHAMIRVVAEADEIEVRFQDRRWLFPREDCVLLPVTNTTAELVARYIGQCLRADITETTGVQPSRVQVAVDENNGQWGVCELLVDESAD